MNTKTSTAAAIVVLSAALAGCGLNAGQDFVPLKDRQRIFSTKGFSFLPPQQSGWLEKFGENEIMFQKATDSATVSFFTQAIEGAFPAAPSTEDELVAFVRSKKEDWGSEEGRYSDRSSSITIEAHEKSCVSYRVSAHDRHAKNKGDHEFLVLLTVGRFCLHPQNRSAATDLLYSVRHIPTFDASALIDEGESFVKSFQFHPPK